MTARQAGQTLVGLALFLPLVLLPVAAYAVQSTLLAARASLLHAAVAQAAEDAASQLDLTALRAEGRLWLDGRDATEIAAETVAAEDPQAEVVSVRVVANRVTVTARERVPLALGGIFGLDSMTLTARATARLSAGYARPSSRLPLPSRILSSAA